MKALQMKAFAVVCRLNPNNGLKMNKLLIQKQISTKYEICLYTEIYKLLSWLELHVQSIGKFSCLT